jgi:hypothetical protein
MEFVECGVCGRGHLGDLFPSGKKQEDGTTPHDNFVCLLCQREARIRSEVDWWLDRDGFAPGTCRSWLGPSGNGPPAGG